MAVVRYRRFRRIGSFMGRKVQLCKNRAVWQTTWLSRLSSRWLFMYIFYRVAEIFFWVLQTYKKQVWIIEINFSSLNTLMLRIWNVKRWKEYMSFLPSTDTIYRRFEDRKNFSLAKTNTWDIKSLLNWCMETLLQFTQWRQT